MRRFEAITVTSTTALRASPVRAESHESGSEGESGTFRTVIMPTWKLGSVLMSKASAPSPSTMLYCISALTPSSRSLANTLPTVELTGADSSTLIW